MILGLFFACSSDAVCSPLWGREGNFIYHLDLSSNPVFQPDLRWNRDSACLRKELPFRQLTTTTIYHLNEPLILSFLFCSPFFSFIHVSLYLVGETVLSKRTTLSGLRIIWLQPTTINIFTWKMSFPQSALFNTDCGVQNAASQSSKTHNISPFLSLWQDSVLGRCSSGLVGSLMQSPTSFNYATLNDVYIHYQKWQGGEGWGVFCVWHPL